MRTAAFNGGYVLGANDPTLSDAQMLTLAKRRDVPEKRFAQLKGPLAVRHVSLHKQVCLLSLIFPIRASLVSPKVQLSWAWRWNELC